MSLPVDDDHNVCESDIHCDAFIDDDNSWLDFAAFWATSEAPNSNEDLNDYKFHLETALHDSETPSRLSSSTEQDENMMNNEPACRYISRKYVQNDESTFTKFNQLFIDRANVVERIITGRRHLHGEGFNDSFLSSLCKEFGGGLLATLKENSPKGMVANVPGGLEALSLIFILREFFMNVPLYSAAIPQLELNYATVRDEITKKILSVEEFDGKDESEKLRLVLFTFCLLVLQSRFKVRQRAFFACAGFLEGYTRHNDREYTSRLYTSSMPGKFKARNRILKAICVDRSIVVQAVPGSSQFRLIDKLDPSSIMIVNQGSAVPSDLCSEIARVIAAANAEHPSVDVAHSPTNGKKRKDSHENYDADDDNSSNEIRSTEYSIKRAKFMTSPPSMT